MPYGKYTWAKSATPTPVVPLVPGPDPQHLTPAPDPDAVTGNPLWVESTPAPTLPDSLTSEPYGTPVGGGGPLNLTPDDPSFGVGVGPGLSILESQDIRGDLMAEDFGAVAAHQYVPLTSRDGSWNVAVIPDVPEDGDSPATLQYQRTGFGQPIDPYARLGKRIKRWVDRYIDMHRYTVTYRPMYAHNANTPGQIPAQDNGNQLTSPFPAYIGGGGTPDTFVNPQERRSPVPWDQPLTTDGVSGSQDFALISWGL